MLVNLFALQDHLADAKHLQAFELAIAIGIDKRVFFDKCHLIGRGICRGRITAVFIKDGCVACDQLVQRLQTSGAEFDLYMVGSRQDDARIRDWAKRAQIDPARVRSGSITLNHDGGRWLSLGLPGDLPAVVREVNGQWQRQP